MSDLDARLTKLEAVAGVRSAAAVYCQCDAASSFWRIRVSDQRADDPEVCAQCGKPLDVIRIHIGGDDTEGVTHEH